ncbi:MAG: cytochrome c oxidase subunit I [Herpetosiphonaceae bacterium]|nr:cytochrome c oxidase subunit I [Herpetosiphonaceae bacterium]
MTGIPLAGEQTAQRSGLGEYKGALSWIASVDHKVIGIMYLATTIFFFGVGGIEAMLMRIQLAKPNNAFLTPSAYNQIFTMHGTTMVFLVVMPMLIGFATYLVPLMIGATDMAFPRLNALSFWLLVFGGLLLYWSFMAGGAPATGWFSYAPLSEKQFSSNAGPDYWALGLLATGIGTVMSGVNFIVTIITLRAPGLTIRRLPLFVWMTLINSFLILFALAALNASLVMLLMDRLLQARFFNPAVGGSAILWQHYFWAFGHPEVYIMVLPAFGIISEVIPVFARKPIFGYSFVAASTVAIAFLSFGVWAHHMFAVGLGPTWELVFGASSMLIAIPTGVKIFNWVATLWGGAIRFSTPMLFCIGFLITFTAGGLSGVTFAIVPIDWATTDSYYVVAHMHYVLFGGSLFAMLAGIFYWFPKVTGKMLDERLGKWFFWLIFIGFHMTFLIQHFLGLIGMPRRIWTYPNLPYWGVMNLISTAGTFLIALSTLVFLANVIISLRSGAPAGDNPWEAWTLEWATTSPPPVHNFDQVPPVNSRRPLWDLAHPDRADQDLPEEGGVNIDIEPNKLGMGMFLLSEAFFFSLLILAYVYYMSGGSEGPNALNALNPLLAGIYTVCLLLSSVTLWRGVHSLRNGKPGQFRLWLLATVVLGAIFLIGQGREYLGLINQNVTISRNLFGTTFFTLTGFHGLHVFSGLVALAVLLGLAFMGDFKGLRSRAVETVELYWHFVDAVWVIIFTLVYLLPHL